MRCWHRWIGPVSYTHLADEIARIETNLSKMDKSVRGYKQLVQAKDRMINNVRANGYEIISLLGQEYNDGMQFQTRFVPVSYTHLDVYKRQSNR